MRPAQGPLVSGIPKHRVGPVAHAGVLRLEHAEIAEPLVQHGRHGGRGIPPRRGRSAAAEGGERRGDDERHLAVVARLLVREVAQPRREEPVAVVEEARGRREDLDVAGPAEALVALRAVGRDRQEVAAHAPHDVLVQALDERVGCLEPARAGHVGVQHDGLDVGGVDLGRQ